jgi:hypothetical protein
MQKLSVWFVLLRGVAEDLSVVGCYSMSTGSQYGRFEAS